MTTAHEKAPAALERLGASEKAVDSRIVAELTDSIKVALLAGKTIAATDTPEADRPLFWSAIAKAAARWIA